MGRDTGSSAMDCFFPPSPPSSGALLYSCFVTPTNVGGPCQGGNLGLDFAKQIYQSFDSSIGKASLITRASQTYLWPVSNAWALVSTWKLDSSSSCSARFKPTLALVLGSLSFVAGIWRLPGTSASERPAAGCPGGAERWRRDPREGLGRDDAAGL